MGYICPVCEDPQADAGHLANHLAFTAITSGDDHEDWLDDHVPGWGELGESELAAEVVEDAEETEYPQVFEASGVEETHDHEAHDHGVDPTAARSRGRGEMDDEARAVLAEARELTEEMRRSADEEEANADADEGDTDEDEDERDGDEADTDTSGSERAGAGADSRSEDETE